MRSTQPFGPYVAWRNPVFAPTLAVGLGASGTLWFSPSSGGVLVVTTATMIPMRLVRVTSAPVLAVTILDPGGFGFPVSILVATTLLFLAFRLWCRTLPPEDHPSEE